MDSILKKFDIMHSFLKCLAEGFRPTADVYLKKTEFQTLMQIKMHEGKPMKYYCEKVDRENGSFTYLADKLEEKGCIRRVKHKADRRIKVLELTEEGHRITSQVEAQFKAYVEGRAEKLSEEDVKDLDDICEKLEAMVAKLKDKEK